MATSLDDLDDADYQRPRPHRPATSSPAGRCTDDHWSRFREHLRYVPGVARGRGPGRRRSTTAEASLGSRGPPAPLPEHPARMRPSAVVRTLGDAGTDRSVPDHHGEALRHRPAERPAAQRRGPGGLRRGPGVPDRPLPGQGGGPEHPGLPLRQRAVRAHLEPPAHRPRPDRRARDPRRSGRRAGLLRADRRLPGHGRHPPLPDPGLRGHGATHRPRAPGHQRGEEQGLPLDAPDRPVAGRPGPVRGIPLDRGGGARLRHRDLRRPAVRDRQLALGRRALLPADGQADGRGRPHRLHRLPGAAQVDVPARTRASAPRVRTI